MAENVLVVCAHSDDQIFGVGGTIAKLSKEGKLVHSVIFTLGEQSHPWMQAEHVIDVRKKESLDADRIVQGASVIFLDVKEANFAKEAYLSDAPERLAKLFKELHPTAIYTHAEDDPHPIHREVLKLCLRLYDESGLQCPLYSFNIWNPLDFKRSKYPLMYVDISDTFSLKTKALRTFRSQINFFSIVVLNNILYLAIYVRAFLNGIRNNTRFAEAFYRVR